MAWRRYRRRYGRRYRRSGRRRRSSYFRPYNFTRNIEGIYRKMTPVLKMTAEARAICERQIEIYSFFTFPLYMKFMGRCYFGHTAIKKLEKTIAYLGYQMKYHKRGEGLVGLTNDLSNSRACIVQDNSPEFLNALGNIYAMSFRESGLMAKIEQFCAVAAQVEEGVQPDDDVQTAIDMLGPIQALNQMDNNMINVSAEIIGQTFLNEIGAFIVAAPWNYNWKNILGNLGNHNPRWNLPGSHYVNGANNGRPVYNILPEREEYMQFNPILGEKIAVERE